jgi:hypothetical protein
MALFYGNIFADLKWVITHQRRILRCGRQLWEYLFVFLTFKLGLLEVTDHRGSMGCELGSSAMWSLDQKQGFGGTLAKVEQPQLYAGNGELGAGRMVVVFGCVSHSDRTINISEMTAWDSTCITNYEFCLQRDGGIMVIR